jgi:hypothetical protein
MAATEKETLVGMAAPADMTVCMGNDARVQTSSLLSPVTVRKGK